MAEAISNRDEVEAAFDRLVASVDFTSPGLDRGLGEDLARLVAEGEIDRTVGRQESPDGTALAANNPEYAASKDNRPVSIGPDRPGKPKGGDMMSLEQVLGELVIGPDSMEMRYGKTPEARDKMEWFQAGREGTRNRDGRGKFSGGTTGGQPPRPTIGLDEQIEDNVEDYIDRFTDRILEAF